MALALIGASGHASAAQIVQNISFSTSATVAGTLNGAASLLDMDEGTAAKFDAALGTLDSVGIVVSGTMTSQANGSLRYVVPLCPAAPTPTPCPANARLELLAPSVEFSLPDFLTAIPFSGRLDVCGTVLCDRSLAALTTDFADHATLTGIALGDYIGSGTLEARSVQNGTLLYVNQTPHPFAGDFSGTMTAAGTVQIAYNYTPRSGPAPAVPEPASLALFGLGLAGLGFMRRRR